MNDNAKCRNAIHGVTCCVNNCRYHSEGDCCTAGEIKVENHHATQKGETYCNTFSQRS